MTKFCAAVATCCVFCVAAKLDGQTAAATPPPLLSDQSPSASILFRDTSGTDPNPQRMVRRNVTLTPADGTRVIAQRL